MVNVGYVVLGEGFVLWCEMAIEKGFDDSKE
jgi:hypothetical protein